MPQEILVIGGTRYFGIHLVETLLVAGHRVTIATRGRTPDPFGTWVRRIAVDRSDATAMQAALGGARFDLVYDQMCYGPAEAALAARLFAGRVGRYLMTSTLEVYDALHGRMDRAYREDDLDLARAVPNPPTAYGDGKRRAEAVLLAANLPVATLRLAHVLGGPEDFTGRLRFYVERALSDEPLAHAAQPGETSFIDVAGAVAALVWAGTQDFRGPLNVASCIRFTAPQLHERVARRLGRPVLLSPVDDAAALSPFDYGTPHAMDLGRAEALGLELVDLDARLDALIDAHAAVLAAA